MWVVSAFEKQDKKRKEKWIMRIVSWLMPKHNNAVPPNSAVVTRMSVTLRDAQHLCWKNFRKINDKLDPQRGKGWTPFVMATDLLEEAGEVAAAIKGLEGFKPPEKPITKEMLATELSDLLYIIFVLAEHYGIELEEAFMQTVNDYMLRFIK
jgi:NTP pyrophosphatase (non-canonical NTP hydrolase)